MMLHNSSDITKLSGYRGDVVKKIGSIKEPSSSRAASKSAEKRFFKTEMFF